VTLAVCLTSPSRLVPVGVSVAGPVKVGADDVVGGHAQLLCAAAVAADRVAADPISIARPYPSIRGA
jgi:hypothetical protein